MTAVIDGIRVPSRIGGTWIPNGILPEGKISARAWGLYAYLLSRPDGWVAQVVQLRKIFKEGEAALYTAIHELVDVGLMRKEFVRNNGSTPRAQFVLVTGDMSELPQIPIPENAISEISEIGTLTSTERTTNTEEQPSETESLQEQFSLSHLLESAPPQTKRKTSRETPLPEDWHPTPEHQAFAALHCLDIGLELVKFRGYAEERDRRAKSWNGAFSRWLANAVTYAARSNGNGYREPERVEVAPTGRHRYPTATHGPCGQSIRYDVTTGEAVDFETCEPSPHHCPATGQVIARGSQ